jgi:hypothetical protein
MSGVKPDLSVERLFLLILLLAALACIPPTDTSIEETDGTSIPEIKVTPISGQFVVVSDIANLRSGPGVEFELVATVANGDIVVTDGLSADGDWYRLIDGIWIGAGFLSRVQEEPIESFVTSTEVFELPDTLTPIPTLLATATPLPTTTSTVTPDPVCIISPPSTWVHLPGW